MKRADEVLPARATTSSAIRKGPEVIRRIKRMIPERYKGPVLARLSPSSYPELDEWRGRKKVIIALAGFYQNLGDMALTYAQKRFLETTLPDYEVLLFPSTHTYSRMKALKRVVGPGDIITTIAGGNMDDVYPSLENARRYVVRSFPRNPVISFPQTIAFTETHSGKRALRRSARTYRSHPRLTVFGREPRTVELMRSGLPGTRIGYSPDIVLSLHDEVSPRARTGIMLTVRDDLEVLLTSEERAKIRDVIEKKTDDIVVRDTVDVALEDCQPETFEQTLRNFWKLLAGRRVVVTDRLHAMIFCVITRTPVVVLPNSNHKIKGTYDAWLKDHAYVRFLDSFDATLLSEAIDELWDLAPDEIVGPDLTPHYEELRKAVVDAAGRRGPTRGRM